MEISVVYEDKNLLVINKPSGIKVHADETVSERAVTDWILENYPKMKNIGPPIITQKGEKIPRPGVVHRLDKATSGLLVLAKDEETLFYLKNEFKKRKIEKTYNCFVRGILRLEYGEINVPIGRSHKDFRRRSTLYKARGKMREALTLYKVLERSENREFSFLEVKPKTGRTHQIRVHLKSISHPIVCDPLYSLKAEMKEVKNGGVCPLGFERLALHASSISFTAPGGEHLKVESDLPDDFKIALEIMRK